MDFGGGSLSTLLRDEKVRDAAEPFVRVLVRVPEAYLLLKPYEATRPGLLVLDADGRRVASVSLEDEPDAEEVAREIRQAREAPSVERFVLRGDPDGVARLAKRLASLDGVESAETLEGGRLEVRVASGALPPQRLAEALKAAESDAETLDPVPVGVEASEGADLAKACGRVPGCWYVAESPKPVAWVCRWLLHPDALKAQGLGGDVVVERYSFDVLPKGVGAVRFLKLSVEHPGALSVIPRVSEDSIEVVGRRGELEPATLKAAFEEAGLKTKPPP
jgi:hypothetical protein